MAILKKTRDGITNFRPAVSTTSVDTRNNPQQTSISNENQENYGSDSIIEQMAIDIVNQDGQSVPRNKLDSITRTINISVSARQMAEWRYLANLQNRSVSNFVRQAVDFYIRKHNL
jgi:hypothetical protein